MVILNCHQVVQCTMNRIILTGFNLDWQHTHGATVINKEVNLPSACCRSRTVFRNVLSVPGQQRFHRQSQG